MGAHTLITLALNVNHLINYITYSGPAVAWVLRADCGATQSDLDTLCRQGVLLSRRVEGSVYYGLQCEKWDRWNKYGGERRLET